MNVRFILIVCCIMTLGLTVTPAMAQNKNVGLGIIVGEPTGLDAKFWLTSGQAVELGVAWSLSGDNELHFQGDYLFHKYGIITLPTNDQLPLFFGVGGRMILRENKDNIVGVRFPVGFTYIFRDYPFDTFGEIVPILDLTPDTDFDLEFAIGARFWF